MISPIFRTCQLLGAAALVFIPPYLGCGPTTLRIASTFFLATIIMAGLHIITGLTRVVSLCHAALVGVGAYAAAVASISAGTTPFVSLLVGIAAAAVIALIIASLTSRLGDHYLAMATLASSEILTNIFRGATSLTGGANGLTAVPALSLGLFQLDEPRLYYPPCAFFGLASFALVALIDRSCIGRAFRAMGDEGHLVESLGIDADNLRVLGFVTGSAMAGLAGGLMAHIDGFVGPESFGVSVSIMYLCFLVIGGSGRLSGVIVGAIFSSIGPELFRSFVEWQMVIVAALSILFLYLKATKFLPAMCRLMPISNRRTHVASHA